MRRYLQAVVLALFLGSLLTPSALAAEDWDIANGHFFTQTGGGSGLGYAVTDDDGGRFWSEFQRFGGVPAVGYPASQRFAWEGFTVQVFQRVIFQWRPESASVAFVNLFDRLDQLGKNDWLQQARQTPPPKKWDEAGLSWDQIVGHRLAVLDAYPAMRAAYFDVVGDAVQARGLPTSDVIDQGNHYALRAQRVVLQQWKEDVPWAKAGQVTVALGGDIAKEAGVLPAQALAPIPAINSPGASASVQPPFELRMNADPGVTSADTQYTLDGINASRAFMLRHFGFKLSGILNVNLRNDNSGLSARFGEINIGVLSPIWLNVSPIGRRGGVAHETGHQLEYVLTNNLPTNQWGDWFLVEGLAGYINDYGLTESGYYPNNMMEACEVLRIVANPLDVPLRKFAYDTNGPTWSIAILAIKDIIDRFGDQAIPTYFQSVRANGPDKAFQMATGGVTLDQFAAQFDKKRKALVFPGNTYSYWNGKSPCTGL